MPTLVATIAAPTKMDSLSDDFHASSMAVPIMKGTTTPVNATNVAVPPTFINSEDLTSRPTRNSRNIAPKSDNAVRSSFGASQPSTLGPISTPAKISPTMPGWPIRSNSSASNLAETNTISSVNGIFAGPSGPNDTNSDGKAADNMPTPSVRAQVTPRKQSGASNTGGY